MTECIRGLFYSRNNLLRGVALLVALACAGLLCADAARGQAQATDPLSALSAGAQRTISQLSSLNAIAAGEWKFHVGDVAHGEAPELDDSSWQTFRGKVARADGGGLVPAVD